MVHSLCFFFFAHNRKENGKKTNNKINKESNDCRDVKQKKFLAHKQASGRESNEDELLYGLFGFQNYRSIV